MKYDNLGKKVIDTKASKVVAVATYEEGAEIIAKTLNYYFGDTLTKNEAIEMMHKNTSNNLDIIAKFLEINEYTADMAIEYLRELSEEMKSQALVVALRDELKFDAPKE